MGRIIHLARAILIYSVISAGWCQNCQDTGWEKISGVRPQSVGYSMLLYTGVNAQGITVTCFNRCKNVNCTAFIIDFERNNCFSIIPNSEGFIPEPNVTFYHLICIKVPPICSQTRLWHVERTLGAVLIDASTTWLPQIMTRNQCYQRCIEAGDNCKSAQFRTTRDLWIGNIGGRCALSMVERGTRPQAYRASMYTDEYLENQCHSISRVDYCSYSEFRNLTMSYSELKLPGLDFKQCEERCDLSNDGFICRAYTIDHSSIRPICLLHAEDTISIGLSSLISIPNVVYKEREPCLDLKVQCNNSSMRVELTTTGPFWGRIYVSGWDERCGIHGSGKNFSVLILPLPGREDLTTTSIDCGFTPAFSVDRDNQTRAVIWTMIVVQFNPIIQRLGDQAVKVGCSLDEHEIPKPRNISVHSDVTFLDPNAGVPPIVSTVVNSSSEAPIVTMRIFDATFKDAVITQLGQKLILKIEIIPPNGPYDISAGHLVASSATGDSSYLLLDEMGCPTDSGAFPALLKDPTDNRSLISRFTAFKFPNSQLVKFNVIVKFCLDKCAPIDISSGLEDTAEKPKPIFQSDNTKTVNRRFHLFLVDLIIVFELGESKYVGYELLNQFREPSGNYKNASRRIIILDTKYAEIAFHSFSLLLKANCRGGVISYGRRRRSILPTSTVANVSEVSNLSNNKTPDELPLQLSIIVRSPVASPDPLLSRKNTTPDTVLIAGSHSVDSLFCVDASLALGLLIFWLIIQIFLTVGCLVTVKRYRRLAKRAEEDRAEVLARHLYGIHGGNFEVARRVRWADHNGSSIS